MHHHIKICCIDKMSNLLFNNCYVQLELIDHINSVKENTELSRLLIMSYLFESIFNISTYYFFFCFIIIRIFVYHKNASKSEYKNLFFFFSLTCYIGCYLINWLRKMFLINCIMSWIVDCSS